MKDMLEWMSDRDVTTTFVVGATMSGWMLRCGTIFAKRGMHKHSAVLRAEGYDQVSAFRDGILRMCMNPSRELSLQWAGTMSATQRKEVLYIMEQASVMHIASSMDGYDPEMLTLGGALPDKEVASCYPSDNRTIQPSAKRALQQAIRLDMGESRRY